MPEFTFVHAADLHLGAPFKGLDAAASELFAKSGRNLAAEAGYAALDNLAAVCIAHNADFLILAGDVYDAADGVLRARFALRDIFLRLETAGVRVFVAHGNHDPLREGPLPVSWPDNVVVFGSEPESRCVMRNGEPLAIVQGMSHASPRETENLAARFVRYAPGAECKNPFVGLPPNLPHDIFQIATLHCAVGGAGDGHAPYAPCSLTDLTKSGFDYWALGHVHQGKILYEKPHVVYPGAIQGMHVNEAGAHGCCVVRVGENGCSVAKTPLAPVEWRKSRLDLGGASNSPETLDELVEAIVQSLEENAASPNGAEALFYRLILEGHTDLDSDLRKPGAVAALLERARGELADQDGPAMWLKDIRLATSPVRDFAAISERGDLAGEIVRIAFAAQNDPDLAEALARPLDALYGHHKLKKILTPPNGDANKPGKNDASNASRETATPAELADAAKSLLYSLLEDG